MKHSLLTFCFVVVFSSKLFAGYSEQEVVAATLIMEAGGETADNAMVAVYEVIKNRSKISKKTLTEICLARKQFSCWNAVQDIEKTIERTKRHKKWSQALLIVKNNNNTNHAKGATHYHSNKISAPSWSKKMTNLGSIGNHIFYR